MPAMRRALRRLLWTVKCVHNHRVVKVLLAFCMVFALFAGNSWLLIDFPDEPSNSVLDAIMMICLVLFTFELVANIITDRTYLMTFFCAMDTLGTISIIFEISFFYGTQGKVGQEQGSTVDPVVLRTARVAKVSARAARFLKMAKMVSSFLSAMLTHDDDDAKTEQVMVLSNISTASSLAQELKTTLATRVSLFTLLLVIIIPMFRLGQYPDDDLSMMSWVDTLEETYKAAYDELEANTSLLEVNTFASVVDDMIAFYVPIQYFPYQIEGYEEQVLINNRTVRIPGASRFDGLIAPVRKQNVMKQRSSVCMLARAACDGEARAAINFNFKANNQVQAGMEIAMTFFVILMMAALTFDLVRTIHRLVLRPLERMMDMVREFASRILSLVADEGNNKRHSVIARSTPDEMRLLELAFEKLSALSSISLRQKIVDQKTAEGMTDEAKGIVFDMMGFQLKNTDDQFSPAVQGPALDIDVRSDFKELDTWELNVLGLSEMQLRSLALHVFFTSPYGALTGARYSDPTAFGLFFESVIKGYHDLPYHNTLHACDVMHCVHRLIHMTSGSQWMSNVEIYSLLVAAIGHDIGHFGKTNLFLVEVGHDWALTYNDVSPLENMHCALLFNILGNEATNVFKALSTDEYRKARKVVIACILHTDNAKHFDMVKELTKTYEVAAEICNKQARNFVGELTAAYKTDVLKKDCLLYQELFLHLSDVSNPLKPFDICKAWAWRVLDEFFAQGDEEKALGLPVGMLNDRDVVNRIGSQHGFINFLVSPLVFAAVRIHPALHPLATQMASNMAEWSSMHSADRENEAVAIKRAQEVQKVAAVAEELRARCQRDPSGRRASIIR